MVGGGRGAGHLLSGSWDFRLEGPASFSSLQLFQQCGWPVLYLRLEGFAQDFGHLASEFFAGGEGWAILQVGTQHQQWPKGETPSGGAPCRGRWRP